MLSNFTRYLLAAGMTGAVVLPPSAYCHPSHLQANEINPTQGQESGILESALKDLEEIYAISISQPSVLAPNNSTPAAIKSQLTEKENVDRILKGTQIQFKKGSGSYFLPEKRHATPLLPVASNQPPPPLATQVVTQADRTIQGIVFDDTEMGIPGSSVIIKGTNIGVVTDLDGKFSLSFAESIPNPVLVVSFIGFTTQEISIGSQTEYSIILAPSDLALSEVVVTAFGLARDKKALGYSTQSINGDALTEARAANVANSLSGRVAGVQVTGNSSPGSGSHIVIRGSSSVAGNNEPLIVVDGVPLEQTSSKKYGSGLSELNPDNIKEINVLKGATAAALYGSRAANGVIMVTTKNGEGTKGIGLEFNSNMTWDNPLVKPNFQNTYGGGSGYSTWYVDGRNGFDADGIRGTAGVDESWGAPMDGRMVPLWYSAPEKVALLPQPNNWEDFWETGSTQTFNVALSGGNEFGSFRLSVGKMDQTSIMLNNDYWRNNFKLNTSYKFTPKLQVMVNAEYIKAGSDNRNFSSSQDFIWAHRHTDYTKLKNWRDYYDTQAATFRPGDSYPYANWQHEYFSNPFFYQEAYTNANEKDRLVANIALTYELNEHFSILVRSGTDFWSDLRENVTGVEYLKNNVKVFGSYQEIALRSQETNNDLILTYDQKLSTDFSMKIQAGAINRTNRYKRTQVNIGQLTIDGLYNLGNYASPTTPSSETSEQVVNSVFGSAQLGFKNYLFLDLTGRNDWSSTLPVDNNSFFYPSAALSAVITDMFNISSDVFSFAKIRASLAQVGNSADPYKLNQVYTSMGLWAGTTPTYTESKEIANRNLKPEITTGKELGMDLRFFQGRLGLDMTYYHQSTVNQILAVSISTASGYNSQILNAGEITNQGIELMLNAIPRSFPRG